ncbi:MAG: thioredoxin domain-containing protein [Leptolyngbya sp. SIO1E4]|nr:thioredoxin domain-containing protein [Leptolyngbya sp. SIO1E4]
MGQDPSAPNSPTAQDPTTSAAEVNPPADLREHQQLVSEVIGDLDRDYLIGDSPTQGNPDADVVLFKFSDFQCPYCGQATGEVKTFMSENASDVLFVYKHLPLNRIHPEATPAALASWAADQQGKFWEYHDALFEHQRALSEALYVEIAEELELDMDQFNRDRRSEEAQSAVARDLALSSELQLSGTPVFIMNDLLIPGAMPADFFAEALTRLQAAETTSSVSP